MYIGYWIDGGLIYGPEGYTGYYVESDQIFGRRGYTRLWIYKDQIHSSTVGNTGFWIENDRIYGPGPELPWVPQTTARTPDTRNTRT